MEIREVDGTRLGQGQHRLIRCPRLDLRLILIGAFLPRYFDQSARFAFDGQQDPSRAQQCDAFEAGVLHAEQACLGGSFPNIGGDPVETPTILIYVQHTETGLADEVEAAVGKSQTLEVKLRRPRSRPGRIEGDEGFKAGAVIADVDSADGMIVLIAHGEKHATCHGQP